MTENKRGKEMKSFVSSGVRTECQGEVKGALRSEAAKHRPGRKKFPSWEFPALRLPALSQPLYKPLLETQQRRGGENGMAPTTYFAVAKFGVVWKLQSSS